MVAWLIAVSIPPHGFDTCSPILQTRKPNFSRIFPYYADYIAIKTLS